jgi:hypothetical protein
LEHRPEFLIERFDSGLQEQMRPRLVHCICCFLQKRLLMTWLTVDSTKPVLTSALCRTG